MRTIVTCVLTVLMAGGLFAALHATAQSMIAERDTARAHYCDIRAKYRRTAADSMRYEIICNAKWGLPNARTDWSME